MFQKEVTVVSSGYDRYDRLLGRIWLGGRDINPEMVREGHAWALAEQKCEDVTCQLESGSEITLPPETAD